MAVRSGILPFNPLNGVKLNSKGYNASRKQEKRALTLEEMNSLLEAIKGSRYYIPCILALQMGLRRGEILGLTWDNVDFNDKTISIEKSLLTINKTTKLHTPKTKGSIRTIKLTKDVYEILYSTKLEQEERKNCTENITIQNLILYVVIKMDFLIVMLLAFQQHFLVISKTDSRLLFDSMIYDILTLHYY